MNIGGDSGQDDYGLPPVDIEIPDDARELDSDVQAYHRELRLRRRRRLLRRLHEPLTRDGVALPLLAGCLVLTLLAGTMLTVYTGAQGAFGPARSFSAPAVRRPPAPGEVGGPLPDTLVVISGERASVRLLEPSVLALVPPGCQCQATLGALRAQATAAGTRVYVVGVDGASVAPLARQVGLQAGFAAEDSGQGLARAYHPAGLTAVFVRSDGTVVSIVRGGQPAAVGNALRAMATAGSQGTAGARTGS